MRMSKIPLSFSCYSLYAWNSDRLIKHRSCRLDKKIEACNFATNRYQHILNETDHFIRDDPEGFTAELHWTDAVLELIKKFQSPHVRILR